MSPPGIYDTPGWGELLEPSATMTQVSDATVSLTELSDNIAVMTSLTDVIPSYTELSDVGVVVTESLIMLTTILSQQQECGIGYLCYLLGII